MTTIPKGIRAGVRVSYPNPNPSVNEMLMYANEGSVHLKIISFQWAGLE